MEIDMQKENDLSTIHSELQQGMALAKCRKCGCMKEMLETLESTLSNHPTDATSDLLKETQHWLKQMDPIQYPCIGCAHCFPAVA
ncbi:MAG: hypothetical protein Q6M04_12980, partial [Thermostichus sp. BF3_bins_97]